MMDWGALGEAPGTAGREEVAFELSFQKSSKEPAKQSAGDKVPSGNQWLK